ncbi:hypothetical protein GCM10010954_17860 [Halobacillus andaensis]|uniref:Uncharacterized protein n=1 Tax=Halobacillus andaensis TaxID=1176239 RepID=A0A917B2P4_HALAA|nr:hypothetical protein [Halobacillus andaensis]MBP2004712.1 hypothetical protein [Halobacillus andaensis]GGF19582.1 hypothetical protein GCM10010954_17860 [Halobacillus andaensis]
MLTSLYMLSLTVLLTFLVMAAVENIQSARKKRKKLAQPTSQATPVLEVNQHG